MSWTAVWWRVKPFSLMEYGAEPMPIIEGFIEREWRSTLGSLSAFTPQAFWINPRSADLLARDKPVQLLAAQQAGFAIPPTCISNDPQAVGGFVAPDQSVPYINLSPGMPICQTGLSLLHRSIWTRWRVERKRSGPRRAFSNGGSKKHMKCALRWWGSRFLLSGSTPRPWKGRSWTGGGGRTNFNTAAQLTG